MNDEDLKELRPMVRRYYKDFLGYVKTYGSHVVREVLRDKQCGKIKLRAPLSGKDRRQMMQMLDL